MNIDQQQLDYERIRFLYNAMSRILIGGVSLALFMGTILTQHLEMQLVATWTGVTLCLYVPRVMITRLFHKKIQNNEINPSNILIWENLWLITTTLALAAFSSLLFFPLANEQLIIISLFLIALSAGSIMNCATSTRTIIASGIVIFIPLVIRFLQVGEQNYTALAFFFIACSAMFANYAMSLNKSLVENIQLKISSEQNSLKDPLTGLYNRRGLYFYLNKIIPQSLRNNEHFGIIIIDVDNFKNYNDNFGHSTGDEALINAASCIEKEGRDGDLVVRYGGEEFLVILPAINIHTLTEVTERIFNSIRCNTNITISAGLAIHHPDLNFDQLIDLADEALYAAKHAGRNQYKVASYQQGKSDSEQKDYTDTHLNISE